MTSAAIEYSYENPYNFEKVAAVFTRIKKVESMSNWNWYYIRYAVHEDEEAGTQYEAQIPRVIYDKAEAEAYLWKTTYILIDREYCKAISCSENAIKSDASDWHNCVWRPVGLLYCCLILRKSKSQKRINALLWIAIIFFWCWDWLFTLRMHRLIWII